MSRLLLALAVILAAPTALFAQADERVIYTSVVDKDGTPVLDLTIKDFIVREDGQAREILRVARDNDPLQIALLVDNSVAMRPRLSLLRKAVTTFIDATREDVQLALITLAERPTVLVGYTTDRAALRKAIHGIANRPTCRWGGARSSRSKTLPSTIACIRHDDEAHILSRERRETLRRAW